MLHSRSSTPNYSSTGDSRSSTWCPPHAAVEDWYRQSDAPSSSRLDHHLPAGDIVPLIVVTSCNDDFEVSSPTSTYSEPDSPTVSTPPPEFSADVHVYDSPRSSLLNPPWTWTFAGGDDGHIVDPDTPESVSQRTVFFGDKTACILPEHSASPSVRCEGRDGQYHAHNTTIVENGRPGPAMLVIAAPKLDLSPIHQFWLNGPALVTRCWAEGNADLTSGTGSEDGVEEEWETAWRSGGPLVKAFAASCSTGSIDDSEENQDENMEYFVKLHNVKAERFVSDSELCCSKLDTIGPHSKVPVEWCGRPESADSSSSWQSSNAEDSRRMAGSDSGSSFYSGSESSFTEEFEASDRFSSKDDCSLRSDISATFVQPLASGICAS
ncbi:hypothetical protein C8Q73DRAFT_478163 [Cubamyces lactineus]|nr:hypothetical protein C8Q73DRAFT_478163 [Cubamyces lactineus]